MDIKILVVDDEESIRSLVVRALSKHGYIVGTASDYHSAVERVRSNQYDIVITDKNMPDVSGKTESGIRLLKYVKKQAPATEVIMMTGYATFETAVEAMKYGAFDYIAKPFRIDDLNEKISRIIEYRSFINSKLNLEIYRNIHIELLNLLENRDNRSEDELHQLLKNLGRRIDHLFGSQKGFESIIKLQQETLAHIQIYAEQLKKIVSKTDPAFKLIQKIHKKSTKRISV